MTVKWTGDQLRAAVERAFKRANLKVEVEGGWPTIADRLAFESALEVELEPFVDTTVCRDCATVDLEYCGDD
jgi:hypothetical protein